MTTELRLAKYKARRTEKTKPKEIITKEARNAMWVQRMVAKGVYPIRGNSNKVLKIDDDWDE